MDNKPNFWSMLLNSMITTDKNNRRRERQPAVVRISRPQIEEENKSMSHLPPPIEPEVEELAKKIKELKIPKIRYLVFSGGGSKGFSFIGCLQAIKRLDLFDLKEVAAVSVGSIISLLLLLKYDPDELYSFITTFEYNMVKSFNFLNAIENWGVETGEKIVAFMQSLVRNKIGKSDITFEELYQYNKIKFTVAVTNLSTNDEIYYNHVNYPNESVITSIRKSMAIPMILTPIKDDDGTVYVDGGMLDNFPMEQVPNSKYTLGFCFDDGESDDHDIKYLEEYLYHVFFSVMTFNTRQTIRKYQNSRSHVVYINPENTSSYSFFINYEGRKMLWDSGYHSTINYFKTVVAEAEKKHKINKKTDKALKNLAETAKKLKQNES